MSSDSEKPSLNALLAWLMIPGIFVVYLFSAMVSDTLYLHGKISPNSTVYRALIVFYRPLVAVKTKFPEIDRTVERWRLRLFESSKNQ